MVDASAVALGISATVLPFFIALATFEIQTLRRHPQASLALALGMSFYFLFDNYLDSTNLGVSQGFYGGLQPFVLIAAFAITFVILALGKGGHTESWPLWIIAVAVSIHSFSEASEVSASASLYLANLNSVFASVSSFEIHKFLEGFVLVAAALSFGVTKFRDVALAGVAMVVFATAGALSSLLPPLGLSPFLAAGVGGWMIATVALASHFETKNRTALLLLVAVGFIIVYTGGLLHFTVSGPA